MGDAILSVDGYTELAVTARAGIRAPPGAGCVTRGGLTWNTEIRVVSAFQGGGEESVNCRVWEPGARDPSAGWSLTRCLRCCRHYRFLRGPRPDPTRRLRPWPRPGKAGAGSVCRAAGGSGAQGSSTTDGSLELAAAAMSWRPQSGPRLAGPVR